MTRIIDTRKVRDGYIGISVVRLADGDGVSEREVASIGDSACVLPYDPGRKVALMVRLARAPLLFQGVETPLIEAPAGMIEPGENAETAIRREAAEEAGVALGALEPVAICWPSPGVLAERSHLFLARYRPEDRTGVGGGLAAEHERIAVEETPIAQLWREAEAGRLADMKTLTLLMALRIRRPELFG